MQPNLKMVQHYIGRKAEEKILHDIYASKEAEFVAVYGRRRIGKTYLINNIYSQLKETIFFSLTGLKDGHIAKQLQLFNEQFNKLFYPGLSLQPPDDWHDALRFLNQGNKYTMCYCADV